MIQDARVLDLEYVPEELHHREGYINTLVDALAPLTEGQAGTHVLIDGPPGSGKTTLARFASERLDQSAVNVRIGEANAMSHSSLSRYLNALAGDARLGTTLTPTSVAASAYLDAMKAYDGQVLVLLDEIDHIDDLTILPGLLDASNVTVVGTCIRTAGLLSHVDPRIGSRLRGMKTLHLDGYSFAELVDILRGRVSYGLAPGSVSTGALERIADLAAGDARQAIALLREAVTTAVAEGQSVDVEMVDGALPDADKHLRDRTISQLGSHQRVLYEIIRERGRVSASTLYDAYEAQVAEPKVPRTRRKYLQHLETYGAIRSEGQTRGREYIFVQRRVDGGAE